MSVLITLAVIVLVLMWALGTYSRVVRLRNQVVRGWKLLDMQLKRRHDLLPNLVSALQSAGFAREPLDSLIAARTRAVSAAGPADAAVQERELTRALQQVFPLIEWHPKLATDQHVRALQESLGSFDAKLASARQVYNDLAAAYNTAIKIFPGNVVSGFGNFKAAELFDAATPEAGQKDAATSERSGTSPTSSRRSEAEPR